MDAANLVDGSRRALQDVVAPELRTLAARTDANTDSIRLLREDFRRMRDDIETWPHPSIAASTAWKRC